MLPEPCGTDKETGRLKRLTDEKFFKYQMRQGKCAFMNNSMAVEGQGGTLAVCLGVWLMLADMFQSCPHAYWVMITVMPEKAWGVIFIAVGMLQLFVLLTNKYVWRKRLLLVKAALWVFLLCTVLYGDWRAPGVPIYSVLAFSAIRGFFCLQKTT